MPTPPKAGSKAEIGHLRRRMRALDASTDAIAAELGRQHGLRPRQAYRLAHGWDQTEATAEYNDLVQRRGPEHDGRDSMTPSRMSEYERWPTSGRRPSPYVLRTLAELYSTTVDRLLDHADLQALSPTERAALTAPDLGRAPSTAVAVRDVSGTMECERVIRRRRRDALVELIRAGGGPDNDLEEFIVASAEQSAEAALWAQAHGIGEANLPILRDQLAALVEQFEHTAPRQMLGRALVVRNRALDLLDVRRPGPTPRRPHPRRLRVGLRRPRQPAAPAGVRPHRPGQERLLGEPGGRVRRPRPRRADLPHRRHHQHRRRPAGQHAGPSRGPARPPRPGRRRAATCASRTRPRRQPSRSRRPVRLQHRRASLLRRWRTPDPRRPHSRAGRRRRR